MSYPLTTRTLADVIDTGNAVLLPSALQQVKLGRMLKPIKVVVTGLAAAAEVDITSDAVKAAATIEGLDLVDGENLPPILDVRSCRVTAGTAAAGQRSVSDSDATPAATLAKLSDDGKTLTFEAAVTGFVLLYQPRSYIDLDTVQPL